MMLYCIKTCWALALASHPHLNPDILYHVYTYFIPPPTDILTELIDKKHVHDHGRRGDLSDLLWTVHVHPFKEASIKRWKYGTTFLRAEAYMEHYCQTCPYSKSADIAEEVAKWCLRNTVLTMIYTRKA